MKILKILYIIWAVFWGIILLYGSLYAYFSNIKFFGDMLKIAFFIYSYPLLPYLSYLIIKEVIKSKNIFIYFYLFLFMLFYFYLFFFISGDFLNYIIALGIYTISFLAISIKLRKELSFYFSLLFFIFLYSFLYFFIFYMDLNNE